MLDERGRHCRSERSASCIGGAESLHGDKLTAERFVERPGTGRTYATGDVVRLRPDGVVEFAGRTDHR
ncbi:MAG: hypothetical protein R2697_11105 [Ilumatobacteraceae bacterium]